MRRFVKAVLVINIAIVLVIGFTGFILHTGPAGDVPANEPILARELFAIYLGYAAMCGVVLVSFERDPRWLLLPPLFLVPLWIDGLYEVIKEGSIAGIPPSVIRPILIAAYLAAFVRMAPRDRDLVARPAALDADGARTGH
jgi:hypothetical protein